MPERDPQPRDPVPTHLEPLVAVLEGPAPCDNCPAANDCGTHRLACGAFTAYVDGASEMRWRAIERQPTRERWGKLFEPEALKGSAALLRQLAKRSRRPVLTAEQRRERWRLAWRLRRARNGAAAGA
jgi:hypothetical protein